MQTGGCLARRAVKNLLSAFLLAFAVFGAGPALADDAPASAATAREPVDDTWSAGTLLSIPAVTIPKDSFLIGAVLSDQIAHAGGGPTPRPRRA
jgi:hypothetical protein